MADSNFIDYVKICCRSGSGGPGSRHYNRTKMNPRGGPDGGDGGIQRTRGSRLGNVGMLGDVFDEFCFVHK